MLGLAGLVCLVVFILARPFDFVPALRQVPFLYIFFGLAALGFVLDIVQKKVPWRSGLHLPWAVALILWALLTVGIRDVGAIGSCQTLLITFSLYFLTAHGVANFRSFSLLAGVFLACTLVVSVACVYQGLQPFSCIAYQVPVNRAAGPVQYGGACDDRVDCLGDGQDPTLEFQCEKVGLAGSASVGHGRVSYLGVLCDPNESAMAVSVGIPLAIAFYQRRRNLRRWLTLCVTLLLAAATIIMSESRGGQLVFLTTIGIYFLRRYRWKGLVVAALLVVPTLLFFGHSRGDADASTQARLDLLSAGVEMFRNSPIMGVGYGQFGALEHQTAHNSYVLAPAELGVLGMICWAMLFWISIKITLKPSRSLSGGTDEHQIWGDAMLAATAGFGVGMFFLSFNFHYLLWLVFGLAGAYHNACINSQTGNPVRIGPKDVALVGGANLALLVVLRLYLNTKGL